MEGNMLKDKNAEFEILNMDEIDLDNFVQFEIPAEMIAGQTEEEIVNMVRFLAMPTSPTKH
jgi:hypothetical protein